MASGFLADLGLRCKPGLVRLRPSPSLGFPGPTLTELAVRSKELARLTVEPRVAVIVENEISYLSVDVPEDGIVFWGKGFEVDSIGRLRWLAEADVLYWGDIDTHGFAILDRLRGRLPRARSVLMGRDTLLAHRDRWVTEDHPAKSVLTRLTPDWRPRPGPRVGHWSNGSPGACPKVEPDTNGHNGIQLAKPGSRIGSSLRRTEPGSTIPITTGCSSRCSGTAPTTVPVTRCDGAQ